MGFTDAGFSATDADAGSNSGFFQGQLVGHVTSALSARFALFSEVTLTTSDDTAYAHSAAPSTGAYHVTADVHRMVLKYTHSDVLKLSIGRFHTPISYWNVTFHHGPWLQTTVARPQMLDFASPFLPLHFTGAFAEGALPTGRAGLGYVVGIGNGRGGGPGRPDAPGDANNDRAWVARLTAKPEWLRGLEIGAATSHDEASLVYGEARVDYGERIWNASVALTNERPEILAEYIALRHRRAEGPTSYTSQAWYVQAAWRFRGLDGRVKPYARWEELRPQAADPLMAAVTKTRTLLGGVRVDVSDYVALKAEYQHLRRDGPAFHNGLFTQACVTF
jgi:hypothetical protein